MSNEDITYVVGAGGGVMALVAFAWLIVRPAWQSYTGVWQRLAATFLTLYVLAALVGIGIGGGAAIVWFWDRWTG